MLLSKVKPISESLRNRAVAAVAAAWESGCPVAGSQPEQQAAIADVCLRRHASLNRRGVPLSDRPAQIRDLARGMVQASGQTARAIGPLMRDYEWLAEKVLAAIASEHANLMD